MLRRILLASVVTATLLGAMLFDSGVNQAMADGTHVSFHNGYGYYVHPGPSVLGAQLYVCPRPTPPLVGHTYITYQPLAPHEFLYRHHRTYRVHHHHDGPTRVFVWWR